MGVQSSIMQAIVKRKMNLFGHIVRMDDLRNCSS
jgi:hypothetical protein